MGCSATKHKQDPGAISPSGTYSNASNTEAPSPAMGTPAGLKQGLEQDLGIVFLATSPVLNRSSSPASELPSGNINGFSVPGFTSEKPGITDVSLEGGTPLHDTSAPESVITANVPVLQQLGDNQMKESKCSELPTPPTDETASSRLLLFIETGERGIEGNELMDKSVLNIPTPKDIIQEHMDKSVLNIPTPKDIIQEHLTTEDLQWTSELKAEATGEVEKDFEHHSSKASLTHPIMVASEIRESECHTPMNVLEDIIIPQQNNLSNENWCTETGGECDPLVRVATNSTS